MARTQYRTIDITTLKGLKTADRLVGNGWRIVRNGMFSVQLEKRPTLKGVQA